MTTKRTQSFLSVFANERPAFYKAPGRTSREEPDLFHELAEPMLDWTEMLLGPGYERILLDGYAEFVVDINRSLWHYERMGRYLHRSYAEVYEATYADSAFMNLYHWGVYATTFLWQHHLEIYRVFRDSFLSRIAAGTGEGHLLDLGSGIWHHILLRQLTEWTVTAVDISETSIDIAHRMAKGTPAAKRVDYVIHDALEFRSREPVDAAISCFLMEHLERPDALLLRLAESLRPAGYAFVTCALTAAEVDHIFEMRRESEPIAMAEEAGFRVLATVSASPQEAPPGRRFLPRSMAMMLQKRYGEIW